MDDRDESVLAARNDDDDNDSENLLEMNTLMRSFFYENGELI